MSNLCEYVYKEYERVSTSYKMRDENKRFSAEHWEMAAYLLLI